MHKESKDVFLNSTKKIELYIEYRQLVKTLSEKDSLANWFYEYDKCETLFLSVEDDLTDETLILFLDSYLPSINRLDIVSIKNISVFETLIDNIEKLRISQILISECSKLITTVVINIILIWSGFLNKSFSETYL
jgi:hypothetical protein